MFDDVDISALVFEPLLLGGYTDFVNWLHSYSFFIVQDLIVFLLRPVYTYPILPETDICVTAYTSVYTNPDFNLIRISRQKQPHDWHVLRVPRSVSADVDPISILTVVQGLSITKKDSTLWFLSCSAISLG